MSNSLLIVLTTVLVVIAFTLIYKKLPFKQYRDFPTKPKLTFFPKFIASFDKPVEEIEDALTALGFKPTADPGFFYRGKVYGDLSAKRIKLAVQIDQEMRQIKVQASALGILFDTGDIWQLTSEILKGPVLVKA